MGKLGEILGRIGAKLWGLRTESAFWGVVVFVVCTAGAVIAVYQIPIDSPLPAGVESRLEYVVKEAALRFGIPIAGLLAVASGSSGVAWGDSASDRPLRWPDLVSKLAAFGAATFAFWSAVVALFAHPPAG